MDCESVLDILAMNSSLHKHRESTLQNSVSNITVVHQSHTVQCARVATVRARAKTSYFAARGSTEYVDYVRRVSPHEARRTAAGHRELCAVVAP